MDSDIKDTLVTHFQQISSSPFLFVGSGFSKRYIGLENWEDLLRLFCNGLKPYEYYVSKSNGTLQGVATQISSDFNELWWSSPDYLEEREKQQDLITGPSSALKISMANHIQSLSTDDVSDPVLIDEIELLSNSNIDGIITTNWDSFLEKLFPEYKVYVGQEELISSAPLSIAEIYKIHGCCSDPNSMVVTSSDYKDFDEKNAYLAAKLITLFVEHPIVFIGYSLSDPNVVALLNSIVKCLTQSGIEMIKNNLIFVQRLKEGRTEGISDTIMALDGVQLPVKSVTSGSFVPIYEAITSIDRKIPANILRHCKEQFYTLVKENDPHGKMSVVDWETIEDKNNIEFFAGIGVVSNKLSILGYSSFTAEDLFLRFINNERDYDPKQLVEITLPLLSKRRGFVPIYKFLNEAGISSKDDYNLSGLELESLLAKDYKKYQSNAYKRSYEINCKDKSISEIIADNQPYKACYYIPFLPVAELNASVLEEFIVTNQSLLNDSNYSTYYRKLICMVDFLKFGWSYDAEVE
jgi:hypothetical protein